MENIEQPPKKPLKILYLPPSIRSAELECADMDSIVAAFPNYEVEIVHRFDSFTTLPPSIQNLPETQRTLAIAADCPIVVVRAMPGQGYEADIGAAMTTLKNQGKTTLEIGLWPLSAREITLKTLTAKQEKAAFGKLSAAAAAIGMPCP